MSNNYLIRVSLIAMLAIGSLATMVSAAPTTNPIDSSKSAQGIFATYFQNMTSTPCAIGSVISGFSSDPDTYGLRTCVSIVATLTNSYPTLFDITWLKNGANISYTGGNVGIGTTSPVGKLDVAGKIIAGAPTTDYLPTGGSWNYNLQLNGLDTSSIGFHDAGHNVGSIRFRNNLFTIGADDGWGSVNAYFPGSVGIGTITPAYKLDVAGKIGSHTTLPTDNDNTVTTKNYVDGRLASLCTSLGGTWNNTTGICTPAVTYSWQLGTTYGACSLSCGGGTQTAPAVCKQSNGAIVTDALCAGAKPAAQSQSCNTQACPVNCSYTTTGLSACSVSCGGGTQTDYYRVTAAAQHGGTCAVTDWQVVGTQACNTQACVTYVYNWRTGNYGGIEALGLIGHKNWRPNIAFWCSKEIVGNTWNDGNIGVADSFCITPSTPKPVERCAWTAWPDNNVVIYECH